MAQRRRFTEMFAGTGTMELGYRSQKWQKLKLSNQQTTKKYLNHIYVRTMKYLYMFNDTFRILKGGFCLLKIWDLFSVK